MKKLFAYILLIFHLSFTGNFGVVFYAGIQQTYAVNTSVTFVGSAIDLLDGSDDWITPTNAQGDTTSTAAVNSYSGNSKTSNILSMTNFNLASAGLPSDAIIDGIQVNIEFDTTTSLVDNTIQLTKDGSNGIGDNKAISTSQTTKAFRSYGSSTDLWGTTWTSAELFSNNFGILFNTISTGGGAHTVNVYRVQVIVEYTATNTDIFHFDAQDMNIDGDINTGEPSNGSSVEEFLDEFNAHTGSQKTVSQQPIYQTGSMNGSLPGIVFDGTNDILEIQDHIDINLAPSYNQKSFAIVVQTSGDITTRQTIYEQGTHEKGYGFQISGGRLYGGVWNTLDWSTGDEYKIIDYGSILPNTTYYITLVHNGTTVEGYLNGVLIGTLNNADTQTIHGICQFDIQFGCSLYSTGGTIGIGGTQNDTLDLANQTPITTYQGDFFTGSIGEIFGYNTVLTSTEVSDLQTYFETRWELDNTAPTISSSIPNNEALFPTGIFTTNISYSDEVGGSGIDITSGTVILQKWDGVGTYGPDISSSYLSASGTTLTTSTYDFVGAPYGKYRVTMGISDIAGNTSTQEVTLYVDEVEMIISTGSLDLGVLNDTTNTFSPEIEIIVHTVGAQHDILLKHNTDLAYLTEDIPQLSGTGYGYDLGPVYSNTITDFGISSIVGTQSASINTNGDKNTYTYRVKIGSIIPAQQAGGDYEGSIDIGIELDY